MTHPNNDLVSEAIKATPVITVGGLTFFGVGLADWVLLAALIYTVFQIYFLLRDKWYRPRKGTNGRK
jgi:predicted benzoate:H+ symporter BenE